MSQKRLQASPEPSPKETPDGDFENGFDGGDVKPSEYQLPLDDRGDRTPPPGWTPEEAAKEAAEDAEEVARWQEEKFSPEDLDAWGHLFRILLEQDQLLEAEKAKRSGAAKSDEEGR